MATYNLGSIADFLGSAFPGLPAGVSGNLIFIVDMARQHVENYTGVTIGSNNIVDRFQPAILNFAKADLVDLLNAQQGGENLSLGELSIAETGEGMSAEQYRALGEMSLRTLGRNIQFRQSLS